MKKRGFGEGRWNGFGGKVSPEETIEEAAMRELREEAGIEADDLTKVGIMEFQFAANLEEIIEVHIFRIEGYRGEPIETEEMMPAWFRVNEIPFKDMWPDDKHWVPLFLAGKKFKGRFLFGESDLILEKMLETVDAV